MKIVSIKQSFRGILWVCMLVVIIAVVSSVIYTNLTLRSIEKNLPNTLLSEINSLSIVLDKMSEVVSSVRIAKLAPDLKSMEHLRQSVEATLSSIVDLRDSYVTDNLINASALHAVVAPAIVDLQIWVAEGISGYAPNSPVALEIMEARISEAFQKASTLKYDSQLHGQDILDNQRDRLERFLYGVNVLFVMTVLIVLCLVYLIVRQVFLQSRETATKSELHKQHNLLESLLENLPLGITVWNKKRDIVHINKSFTEITGYSFDDMPNLEKWPKLAYPDPLYRQYVRDNWKKALKHNAVSEYRVTCKNGEVKDIEFRATFLPDSRVINTLTDVSQRNKNEKALRESQEKKARSKKMESLGLLAGGVAHDLNNILSGVVSYPELILLDLPEDHKLRKPVEIMRDSGNKAAAIVQDLLTVARGVAIAKEPVNINVIIQSYLESPDFKLVQQYHPNVTIDVSLAEDLFNIAGSQVHIRKILMNLVSNACEAIERSGKVYITTLNSYVDTYLRGYNDVEEGEYVILSIADEGKGISDEDLERIFEPFYSKKMMGRSGTGLGLAVVWNVVQDHNGYINVLNTGEGTTFNVYFPITRERLTKQKTALNISDYGGMGEFLLIVDDVESQRHITLSIVEILGYEAASESSGEAAVEFIKKHPVDLVILDMIMDPGINGRETYEKMLQLNPKQKAIISSGFAETEDVKKALQLGVGCYLKKPLKIQDLGIAIKKELGGQE